MNRIKMKNTEKLVIHNEYKKSESEKNDKKPWNK